MIDLEKTPQPLISVSWHSAVFSGAGEFLTRDLADARAKAETMKLAGWTVETREAISGRAV